MAETSFEWGVKWCCGDYEPHYAYELCGNRADAEHLIKQYPEWKGVLIVRTVTVSDWQTDLQWKVLLGREVGAS